MDIETDHPEFKKLAFTSPGPKNAFAPLQRSGYGRQHHVMVEGGGGGGGGGGEEGKEEPATTTTAESELSFIVSLEKVSVVHIFSTVYEPPNDGHILDEPFCPLCYREVLSSEVKIY